MLRVAVCSDSHGTGYIERFCLLAKRADEIIFLGDVLDDAREMERILGRSILKVAGNCDCFSRESREIVLAMAGAKLLLCHGDAWGVKYGLDSLAYRAAEVGANAALFGHTHRAFSGYVGETLLINPGALKDKHYAMLEIKDGQVVPKMMTL